MHAKLYLNLKRALMLDEQSCRRQNPQKYSHISPQLPPQELTLQDISPKWASRLKSENIPTFMSPTWLRWRFELQQTSKCVIGEAYGYSSEYTEKLRQMQQNWLQVSVLL
jgi:hypothetical protein